MSIRAVGVPVVSSAALPPHRCDCVHVKIQRFRPCREQIRDKEPCKIRRRRQITADVSIDHDLHAREHEL